MTIKKDWEFVTKELERGLRGVLDELIDGTITELDGTVRLTAQRMVLAAKRGQYDLVEASKDQLAMLVIEKELRLKVEGFGLFERLLSMGINALISGAVAGLGGLKAT